METKHECKYCGKPFQPTCHATRQIFCSKECRIKNNNANRYAPPGNACLECGKTLDQKIQRGRNRKFCDKACDQAYHVKKMLEKKRIERQTPRPCPNCGKDFVPMWEKGGTPRFCSDECRIVWWREYHKAHPSSGGSNTKCAYCGQATDGHGGKYCSRACYRLGAAHVRGEKRCSWCGKLLPKKARSTQKYCCQACAKAEWSLAKRGGPKRRCITAHNPSAWQRQLAELTSNAKPEPRKERRILLVCGTIKSTSMDAYVDFIRYQLECNPFDGNLYVFCNTMYTLIKWLEWDGSGFCVGFRKAEWGKYPWPLSKTDEVMEISEQEFAFLRSKTTLGVEEEMCKTL